jgi:hypothetical protein
MSSIDEAEAKKALGLVLDMEGDSDDEAFNVVKDVVKQAGQGLQII